MEIKKIDNSNLVFQVDKNLRNSESLEKGEKQINENTQQAVFKTDINKLDSAVEKANTVLFKNNTHLQFRIHDKTNEVMVKIIDNESGEVLKEIPPEKMLDMVAKLWEIAGILIDEKR